MIPASGFVFITTYILFVSTEAQLFFEPFSFQEMEGASFNVCLRLGGEGWFELERDIEVILGSDGGKEIYNSYSCSDFL